MIPINQTPFIGRENDLKRASEILLIPDCRLLTLLGVGGIGKTRFASQLAHHSRLEFQHGIYFVDLQLIETSNLLIPAIAETLNCTLMDSEDNLSQLITFLGDQTILLVLDNFEHMIDASLMLTQILTVCPHIKLLVTSREALNLQEEHIFTLQGLSTPDATSTNSNIVNHSSVQLFLDRAQQIRHDFKGDLHHIAEICRIVEGNPLAIELSAMWAKVLNSSEILIELKDCMDFLSTDLRNVPERHRSIRAVFNGAWNRLSTKERNALMRLAVFQSGFGRSAVKAVTGTDLLTLSALRDKSLLKISEDGRYSIHELIRQYAREKLETDTIAYEHTHKIHSQYYASLTQQITKKLQGNTQVQALSDFKQDIQNIRLGWLWAVKQNVDELIQDYLLGIALFYQMQSQRQELLQLLTLEPNQTKALSPHTRAQILLLRAWLLIIMGQNHEGVETAWEALQIIDTNKLPLWFGMALVPVTNQPELLDERYHILTQMIRNALENVEDKWHRAWLLKAFGEIDLVTKNYEQASHYLQESGELFLEIGDGWGATWSLGSLGRTLYHLTRYEDAEQYYQHSIAICQQIGDLAGLIDLLNKLSNVMLKQERYQDTERLLLQGFTVALKYRVHPHALTYPFDSLVQLRIVQNRHAEAVEYLTILINSPLVRSGWREIEIAELPSRLDALQSQLSESAFKLAIRRGQSIDLVDKIRDFLLNTNMQIISIEEKSQSTLIEPLTEREAEILQLIATGQSNREIANHLTLAIGTIKTHAHNIYAKLGVTNRTEATTRAYKLNLV